MSPELLRWSHSGCAKGNNCHLSNRKKPTIPISLWWIKHQCEEKPLLGWCNSLKLYSTKYHMTACFLNIPQHFSALLQQQSSENVNHVKQSENSSFICLIETINVHQCATTHTHVGPHKSAYTHMKMWTIQLQLVADKKNHRTQKLLFVQKHRVLLAHITSRNIKVPVASLTTNTRWQKIP